MFTLGSVTERLSRNRYVLDEEATHIEVGQEIVRANGTGELLVRVCPAHVFSRALDGSIVVQHAACVECGACLAVAAPGSLRWHYPCGGFGVPYREVELALRPTSNSHRAGESCRPISQGDVVEGGSTWMMTADQ